jgi:hypothetical protein
VQIRPTGQPIPVSKVETDRREEVKNIKPIGVNQIPDSFETGGSKHVSAEYNSSASAAPEKKAGQITDGILIKQLTQGRLAGAGIKLTNDVKENSGVKDFNDTQQGQADVTSPKVDTKGNPSTPGATTDYGPRVPDGAYTGDARSNMENNVAALTDFFAQHNIDVSGSGDGTVSAGTGSGIDASQFGRGDGVDLGNGFNNGPQGPGDPMDSINDRFARMDYLDGLGNAGNRLTSQMKDATQGMDGADSGHDKGMVADGGVEVHTRQNPDGTSTDIWHQQLDNYHAKQERTERQWGVETITDYGGPDKDGNHVEHHEEEYYHKTGFTDYVKKESTTDKNGNTTTTEESGTKNPDGSSKSKSTTTTIDANGNITSTSVTTTTKTKDGKTTTTTTTTTKPSAGMPKNDVDPEAEKKMKWIDGVLENLGLDGIWNHQRGPKDQGKGPDYGPEGPGPVGVSAEDAGGSLLSQFGKDGLVGNPNQQNHDGSGPSNFGGLPGSTNTDPLEGTAYNGVTRDEEVDVSVHTGIKQHADDEENDNQTSTEYHIEKQQIKLNSKITGNSQ